MTVTAAESCAPLAGAEAILLVNYLDLALGCEVYRTVADAAGVAHLRFDMPAGSEAYENLFVRYRGRQEWRSNCGGRPVTLRHAAVDHLPRLHPDDHHRYTAALPRGATVRGVVRNAAGPPLAGAKVRAKYRLPSGGLWLESRYSPEVVYPPDEVTDADGRFELWSARTDLALEDGGWAGVTAYHPDGAVYCLPGSSMAVNDEAWLEVELGSNPRWRWLAS